jgi:hypothetical protein
MFVIKHVIHWKVLCIITLTVGELWAKKKILMQFLFLVGVFKTWQDLSMAQE